MHKVLAVSETHHTAGSVKRLTHSAMLVKSKDSTLIYADAVGDATKPALVFVHGFSSSAAVFDGVFEDSLIFARDYYLVRYDLRGFGRSGKPEVKEAYESRRFAEDFEAVCEAFEVKKAAFVGWSMGATILADIFAANISSPKLIAAVCISGSPCIGPALQAATSPALVPLATALLSPTTSADEGDPNKKAVTDLTIEMALNKLMFLKQPSLSQHGSASGVDNDLNAVLSSSLTESYFKEYIARGGVEADLASSNDLSLKSQGVSFFTRMAFFGMSALQKPAIRRMVALRTQDSGPLLDVTTGKEGFPILLVFGSGDAYASGAKLRDGLLDSSGGGGEGLNADDVRKPFARLEYVEEGGSHAVIYENPSEVMEAVLKFANKYV